MNYKFKMKMVGGEPVDFDCIRYMRTKKALPDGDYELIIRKAIKWDTGRMNRYFHGPVLTFIMEQFKTCGTVFGKDEIKQYLKGAFGKTETVFGRNMLMSTAGYDFDTYTKFLNDINDWSVECFKCELPPAEQVD